MATSVERPPRRRFRLVLLVGLLLVCVGLLAYHLLTRDRSEVDPEALKRLETASLPEVKREVVGSWPQWRGPYRDGVSAETGLLTHWPEDGPPVVWRADSGVGISAVSVSDGRAFTLVQADGAQKVVCWDAAATGPARTLWSHDLDGPYTNDQGEGPRSTPTIADGRVYAVSATGKFHCLTADTGKPLWQHDLLAEFHAQNLRWGTSFSALVDGDLVYTNPGGPNGYSVVAFHTTDGSIAWHNLDDPAGYSSPIITTAGGKRQVLVFTGIALVSLDAQTGKEYWRYPWKTNYGANIATPIAVGDYVFISSGYNKGCALLEIAAGSDGTPTLRTRVYENNRMCNHFSSSVYYQGYLYGFNDATLTCMDFRNKGEVRWKQRGFNKGSLLIADGHLVILGESGKLALAKATPDGYVEETSYQLKTSQHCWTVPALADGKLYVRVMMKDDDGKERGQVLALKVK